MSRTFGRQGSDLYGRKIFGLWTLICVAFLLTLLTDVLGSTGSLIVNGLGTIAAPGLAGAACLVRWRRLEQRYGRPWLLLGLAMLSWAAGAVVWAWYDLILWQPVPEPSIGDVGYLGAVPLAVAALLSIPGVSPSRKHLLAALDGVIAAGALLFVSWTAILAPRFALTGTSPADQVGALIYPVIDVLTATMALLAMARARHQRGTMFLVASGLLLVAVTDSAYFWFTAENPQGVTNLLSTGLVAGFLLIGIAATRAKPVGPPGVIPTTPEPAVDLPGRFSFILPYIPLLISLPWAVLLQVRDEPIGDFAVYLGLFLIAAMLIRQLLSLRINLRLSRDLLVSVAELRRREVELQYQAFHDPLTGLANRTLLADRIDHALRRSHHRAPVILLLADLDDFKLVNDTLGHPVGDALLVGVANRLLGVVRPEDTVARLGGDEFAVLLDSAEDLASAKVVADRVGTALGEPFVLAGLNTVIGASIGIAMADENTTGDGLLQDADIAMYAAKNDGKGQHAVFVDDLAAANMTRLQLKADIGGALAASQLSLKYQPVVDLASGQVSGVEALLRWDHPVQGEIDRTVFIPLAETTGAIVPIGRWVLEQACAEAGRWDRQRQPDEEPITLSVNVSSHQLRDPSLIRDIGGALVSSGLRPELLVLEVTEKLLREDKLMLAQMNRIRAMGVHLAVDDFGTGHSALGQLRRFPIEILKVHESLTRALTPDAPVPDVLITAILTLGHGLGMEVIAEGVETLEQMTALRELGCPKAQGFLFAKPADPEVITHLLRDRIPLVDAVQILT